MGYLRTKGNNMTYSDYKQQCQDKGYKPTLTLKQWNEMMGIENEPAMPSLIRTQTHVKLTEPTLKNHITMEK